MMIKLKTIITESIPDYFRGYFDNIDSNVERLEKNIKQLIKDLGKDGLKKEVIDKELEIIKAEITNSGKPPEMAEKISKGKIAKFISDNTLLNQIWIMDPKKKVSDILKENKIEKDLKVLNFIRYKVGEGV